MEPNFWGVAVYLIPAFALVFFLVKRHGHQEKSIGHNTYRNYRKTRMDKPVL
ncbi:hypothetical protein [Sediminibacterium soli]|uniref:hypothetical protein n=1 Tax=Sediminibacterium soli TaxID=2698829 RepID=UPI00137B2009|nr:hypothetical protein [Sediminibacterium soli]NCI47401.1 hypothetical protein [Sediminibacterium soli]